MEIIIDWVRDKYIYIAATAILTLIIVDIIETWKSNKKFKTILLILVFFFIAEPAYNLINPIEITKETFITSKGNIEFLKGDNNNIMFTTQKDIKEPVDLRIKDNWARLVYLTDYELIGKRRVMIGYEFGNNDEYNQKVANNGLVFTYKARRHSW